MPSRRCGICREPGHDRRNCPTVADVHAANAANAANAAADAVAHPHDNMYIDVEIELDPDVVVDESGETCILCGSFEHEVFDCPIAHRQMNSQSRSMKKKIYWDKCKCGKENNGSTYCCACGEKQIAPVPKNEKGVYECGICYADLRELNKVTTKCGHHFCIDCFLAHHNSGQASSGDCPMCRAQILEVEEPEQLTLHQEMIIDAIRTVHRQLLNF